MRDSTLGKLLGSGNRADVFECGELAVKLYKSVEPKRVAFREAAVLALVESLGLPVPSVWGVREFDGRWGVMMARAEAPCFLEAMRGAPDRTSAYLKRMAQLHLQLHGKPAPQLPSLKPRLAGNVERATILGEARRNKLLRGLAMMPDGERLCHGDFHPLNIMGPDGSELIVDWADASQGQPAADVCRSYVLIRRSFPDLASAYVDAYVEISGESRGGILGWLPFVAAARLTEDVPDEVDALMTMVDCG